MREALGRQLQNRGSLSRPVYPHSRSSEEGLARFPSRPSSTCMAKMPIPMKYLLICATLLLAVSCGPARQQSVSRAPDANRSVVNPPGIAPLVPAYSVAIRAGDLVFVSGMTGIKPGTQEIVDGGVAAQTRQTLENIRDVLRVAGATMADVAECTVFLRNMADYATMNGVYRDFFPLNPPARATVAVTALPRPAALVEIKCSAQVKRQ